MKYCIVFVLLLSSTVAVNLNAQNQSDNAQFFYRAEQSGGVKIPTKLEKEIHRKTEITGSDTCISLFFAQFTIYPNFIDTVQLKVCRKKEFIEVCQDTQLIHRLPRKNDSEGILWGKTTRLNFRFVRDSLLKTTMWVWEENVNKSNLIVFKDSIVSPAYEAAGEKQRSLMDGPMFHEFKQKGAIEPGNLCTVEKLKIGSRLQFLLENRSSIRDPWKKAATVTYTLERIEQLEDFYIMVFSNHLYYLDKEYAENRDSLILSVTKDVVYMNSQLGIPFTAMQPMFKISNPKDPNWNNYMILEEIITNPLIELCYRNQVSIGNSTWEAFSYWNTLVPSPYKWIKEFPIAWRNTDNLRLSPIFMKLNDETFVSTTPESTKKEKFKLVLLNEVAEGFELSFENNQKDLDSVEIEIKSFGADSAQSKSKSFKLIEKNIQCKLDYPSKKAEQSLRILVYVKPRNGKKTLHSDLFYLTKNQLN